MSHFTDHVQSNEKKKKKPLVYVIHENFPLDIKRNKARPEKLKTSSYFDNE